MPIVEVPGLGNVEFPEGTSEGEILSSVQQAQKNYQEVRSATEPAGAMQEAGRQAGLTVRGLTDVAGVGALAGGALASPSGVGIPVGAAAGATITTGMDLTARAYNYIAKQLGATGRLPVLGDVLEQVKTDIGLPRPVTPTEKMAQSAMGATTSMLAVSGLASTLMKSASPAIRALGTVLSVEPYQQFAPTIAGSIASSVAEQEGAGPVGQGVAGVVGSMAPTLPALGRAGLQSVLRGRGGREEVAKNIQTFREAGTTPTAGQATGSMGIQGVEAAVGKVPFAASVIKEKAKSQQAQIGARVEEIRRQLSQTREPEIAGRKMGMGFEEAFVPRARQVQRNLYAKAESLIPPTLTRISPTETEFALEKVLQKFSESPELRSQLGNKQLTAIQQAIKSGKNEEGKIVLSTLRDLRSWAGEELANVSLTPTIARSQVKALYGAISKDFADAMNPFPATKQAFSRANNYTRSFHDRMDAVQNILTKQNADEVFKFALAGANDGPSRLRKVLQSVPKDAQKAAVSAFVAKMGKSLPGVQNFSVDPEGALFSTQTFLTNYNKLNPQARNVLFGRFGSKFQNDINKIAEVSSRIRESSKVLSNPSGTATSNLSIATLVGIGASVGTGQVGYMGGVAGVLGLANLTSRLLTNPNYVGWLAKNIDKPVELVPSAIANLEAIATRTEDPDLVEMAKMLQQRAEQ